MLQISYSFLFFPFNGVLVSLVMLLFTDCGLPTQNLFKIKLLTIAKK